MLLKSFCICFEQKEQLTFPQPEYVHAVQEGLQHGSATTRMEVEVAKRYALPVLNREQPGAARSTECAKQQSEQDLDQTVVESRQVARKCWRHSSRNGCTFALRAFQIDIAS